MKTFSAKPLEVTREWYVVDATDKIVGHLAAEIRFYRCDQRFQDEDEWR